MDYNDDAILIKLMNRSGSCVEFINYDTLEPFLNRIIDIVYSNPNSTMECIPWLNDVIKLII